MTEQILPTRWEIELEFVQSLANLQYVNYLAQNRYLEDPTFLNYLRYLTYWKKPEYARHLVYPNCLHILDLLLESKSFRERIMRADAMGVIMNEMVGRWKQPQDIFAVTPLAEEKKEKVSKNNDEEEIKKEPLNSVDGTPMSARAAASTNPTPTGTVI